VLSFRASLSAALFAVLAASPAFATAAHPTHTSKPATHSAHQNAPSRPRATTAHPASAGKSTTHTAHKKANSKSRRPRGQQAIQPERVIEIQQALIREHFLAGPANGNWDAVTIAAMQKYQAAQGWQTKLMPDSRALKKLGLGPDYSNAINAKNSTFVPPPASAILPVQSEGFAEAAGVSR